MKLTVAATTLASATLAMAAITPEMLTAIAPDSAECKGGEQCRTAAQVAPLLDAAFAKWGITNGDEMAAVTAMMAMESVQFQFNRNQSPGRPGQGTANMQMPNFNVMYARALAEGDAALKPQVDALNLPEPAEAEKANPAVLDAMLTLLTQDQYNFGSGPWFMASQCKDAHDAFTKGADEGWAAYLKCVGVEAGERQSYFDKAKTAFAGYKPGNGSGSGGEAPKKEEKTAPPMAQQSPPAPAAPAKQDTPAPPPAEKAVGGPMDPPAPASSAPANPPAQAAPSAQQPPPPAQLVAAGPPLTPPAPANKKCKRWRRKRSVSLQ